MTNGILDSGQKIVTDGLVLNYDIAQLRSYPTTGTAITDISGNGNTGTLINGVAFDSGNGGNLLFDGVNDYVNLLKDTDFPISGNSRTISVWFKTPSIYPVSSKLPALFAYGTSNFTNSFALAWEGRTSSPLIQQYKIILSNYGNQMYNNTALSLNTVYNITVTKLLGNENYSFYLNGNIDGVNTWTDTANYKTTNTILNGVSTLGTSTQIPGNMYWKGNISQVQIYNRALSSTEVLQNFNANRLRYGL